MPEMQAGSFHKSNNKSITDTKLQHLHEVIKQDGLAFENGVLVSGIVHVLQMEGSTCPVTGT